MHFVRLLAWKKVTYVLEIEFSRLEHQLEINSGYVEIKCSCDVFPVHVTAASFSVHLA